MMAQVRRDFPGRGEIVTLSRPRIQPMGDGHQLALGVARQVRALGPVLAQQVMQFVLDVPMVTPVWQAGRQVLG